MPEHASAQTGRERSHHPEAFAQTVASRPPGRLIEAAGRFRAASQTLEKEIDADQQETTEALHRIKAELEKKGISVIGVESELAAIQERKKQTFHDWRVEEVQRMIRGRIAEYAAAGREEDAAKLREFIVEDEEAAPAIQENPQKQKSTHVEIEVDEPEEKSGVRWKAPSKRPEFEISDADIDNAVETLGKDGSTG